MQVDEDADVDRLYGSRVKGLRERRELTQAEMVEALHEKGISYMNASTLSRIENGTRPLRLAEAVAFSKVFQMPLEHMTYFVDRVVLIADSHRRARREYVLFRNAVLGMSRAQHSQESMLREIQRVLDSKGADDDEGKRQLELLEQNIRQFLSIDMVKELETLRASDDARREFLSDIPNGGFLLSRDNYPLSFNRNEHKDKDKHNLDGVDKTDT